MNDEAVELREAPLVDQRVDPFASGQLPAIVLFGNRVTAGRRLGRLAFSP
jgi:hypothetical protein